VEPRRKNSIFSGYEKDPTKVGTWKTTSESSTVDATVWRQRKCEVSILDLRILPVHLEGVVLPVLEVPDHRRGVAKAYHQSVILDSNMHWTIPGVAVGARIFVYRQRRCERVSRALSAFLVLSSAALSSSSSAALKAAIQSVSYTLK
jgi:hypothetical protein